MEKIKDVLFGKTDKDGKNYHCPNCGKGFNFMDVIDGIAAKPVNTHERVYRCDNCHELFRMPE